MSTKLSSILHPLPFILLSTGIIKAGQSEPSHHQLRLEGCDAYKDWIIEGVYTVMLIEGYTFEQQHEETIGLPNLNKHVSHRFHRNTDNVDMYTSNKISEDLLKVTQSDRAVWHINCVSSWGELDGQLEL
jgi:hypothetical protein